jgi:hypothetical protein
LQRCQAAEKPRFRQADRRAAHRVKGERSKAVLPDDMKGGIEGTQGAQDVHVCEHRGKLTPGKRRVWVREEDIPASGHPHDELLSGVQIGNHHMVQSLEAALARTLHRYGLRFCYRQMKRYLAIKVNTNYSHSHSHSHLYRIARPELPPAINPES